MLGSMRFSAAGCDVSIAVAADCDASSPSDTAVGGEQSVHSSAAAVDMADAASCDASTAAADVVLFDESVIVM